MVTDTDGYICIIEYLTEHLSLFENSVVDKSIDSTPTDTVIHVIEIELIEQIISVCNQNEALTVNKRNKIIQEVDTIVSDLEEILSSVVNNPVTPNQQIFIKEFATLIKNLFDSEINNCPENLHE